MTLASFSYIHSVRTDFGGFWKVMEIDSAIFQDLESYGKGRIFNMAMEKLWIFVWETSKMSYNDTPYMFCLLILLFII